MEETSVRPRDTGRGVEKGLLKQAHGRRDLLDKSPKCARARKAKICACWSIILSAALWQHGKGARSICRLVSSHQPRSLGRELRQAAFRQSLFHRPDVVPNPVPQA